VAAPARLRILLILPLLVGLGLLLSHCGGNWEQVEPPTPNPFDDDDDATTPAPPDVVVPELLAGPVRNFDAGWVAHNPNQSWSSLVARAGGVPFRPASIVYTRASSATWAEPNDGSNPDAIAVGTTAALLHEAIAQGRYAALRIHATEPDDLPSAWETTQEPAALIPDGRISLVLLSGSPGDDDDSAGDDDDSAGDDDDSAGDDDDSGADDDDSAARSTGRDDAVWAPNYADPDYRDLHAAQIAALGASLSDGPGLAFVDIGGVGALGGWDFEDPEPWFGGAQPIFSEASWAATVMFYADLYESAFPGVPLFIPYEAVAWAGEARDEVTQALVSRGVGIRDDCMGGCLEPDFDRFPGQDGEPYPADDPYGGWLPAELWQDHPIQYEGSLGGLGTWRLEDNQGDWDVGTWGAFDAYFRRMLDVRVEFAPPSLVSMSGTACTSEWVVAADPPGSACAPQTPGAIWEPLVGYGEQIGYRYVVTEVRVRPDWEDGDQLEVEFDLSNAGSARSFADRQLQMAFVDVASGVAQEPASVTLPSETSAWLPGTSVTLTASLSTAGMDFAGGAAWALTLRVVEPRAFGGGIALPHPTVGDEARHVLASWPFEGR
jgi:hypothetical protein